MQGFRLGTNCPAHKSWWGKVSAGSKRTVNDLPGYVSKQLPSGALSPGLQPPLTAHIACHPPAGVLSAGPASGASVFQAGCRIERSEGQAGLPVAEQGQCPLSSEKSRITIRVTGREARSPGRPGQPGRPHSCLWPSRTWSCPSWLWCSISRSFAIVSFCPSITWYSSSVWK